MPRSIDYIEMDLRNKTTSEFRTVFDSPFGASNSPVPVYMHRDALDLVEIDIPCSYACK